MVLLISAWYNEQDYKFKFSSKVNNFIRDQIRKDIFPKYGLDVLDEQWYLNLVIATDSSIKKIEVRGPDIRKRQRFVDYGLWLPYTINQSQYPLSSYLDHLFEALALVFGNYGVLESDMKKIEEQCKVEILSNKNYE